MTSTARRVWFRLAAAALLISAVSPARPEDAAPCVLDKCLGQAPVPPSPTLPPADGPAAVPPLSPGVMAPGNFDFYVLSLSWSPGFCATGGDAKAPQQCAAGSHLGFVVHGLWPQYTHGFPSDCGPAGRTPSRLALDSVVGLYPDEGLARYEWRKHGTCSGKSPTDYFADVKRARQSITIPPPLQTPQTDQSWVPIDIARAFVAANSGLRTDAMAVTCRQNMLEEVRICLGKDLRGYVTCPEVSRASCRRPVTVPALR